MKLIEATSDGGDRRVAGLPCRLLVRSLVDVVRLDLAPEVVARGGAERAVHEEEAVVDRGDHERPPHEEHARQGERGVHREADLVGGPVDVHEVVEGQRPLEVRRPEVDVEGTSRGLGDVADRLRHVVDHGGLDGPSHHEDGAETHSGGRGRRPEELHLGLAVDGVLGHLPLGPAAQLVPLGGDVEGVARGQDVVPRLHHPREAHEEAAVEHLRRAHPLVDDLGAQREGVIGSREAETPVRDGAPEVGRHGARGRGEPGHGFGGGAGS
mmetsp:Transcript_30013/g.65646  ORF Transcript_30013/g.65646 Transcript_30013/m.65646 type:complete len:268 (+) Transcript_30013:71-874(+)